MLVPLRVAAAVTAGMMACTAAPAIDLHRFWEGRCQECHGKADAFARARLAIVDGVLVGASHPDLKQFLALHEAGAAQADGIYAMLLAQAQAKPMYEQKCGGCHEGIAQFARQSLEVRNGVVIGHTNRLPISEFLKRHGKLTAEELPIVVENLTQVLKEIGMPAK